MKRILPLLTYLLGFLAFNASAQWVPITHVTGTQIYTGPDTITVTNNNGITGGGCGGQYWIQQTGASYTFNFTPAVDAIWIMVDAINTGESIEISINGNNFPISNCNLVQTPFVNNCSVGNCNIVNGQFVNNTPFWVCGGIMIFYGPINSFTITEPIGGSGTTFNISFVPPGGTIPAQGTSASYVLAGSNSPICEGSTLDLTASFTNSTYSWTGPNGFTSNQRNPSIPNATAAMSGSYIVTSVTACGILKDTVLVDVFANPATPVLSSNSPVCEGYPINLTASNVPVGTIAWTGPAGFTSTQQNPVIPGAQMTFEGTYTAVVTNGICVSQPASIFVDMNPTPLPPIASHIQFCQFSPAPPVTATGTSLKWYTTVTGGVGSPAAPVINNTVAGVSSYWVSQTVNGCESPRTQVNVTVKPKPVAPFYVGPTHYCLGDPVAGPVSVSGTNIQWYDNNQNPIGGAPTVSTAVPGDYTWYATQTQNGCESDKGTIFVHVAAIPAAPVTADITKCQFDPKETLTAIGQDLKWYDIPVGGSPYVIAPAINTDQPTNITWYVSQTVDGCESPRSPLTTTINFTPTSTFDVSRPLVCENDTLRFTYTGNGTPSNTYTWTIPDNDSIVLVSGTLNSDNPLVIRYDSIGTFPITLNVENLGCQTTTTYNVKVVVVPQVVISAPSDVCIHDSVQVGLGSYNSSLATLNWNFGGGVNVLNDVGDGPYMIRWDNEGLHTVSVTVSNTACQTSNIDTVKVHNAPDASFSATSATGVLCLGDSVRLAAKDNDGLYSYEWSPERFFNHENNFAPVVNAYIMSNQEITLKITTPWGCEAMGTKFLDPQSCCVVSVPNVFSPNGDGKNDIFKPITVGTHSMKQFTIVNRWGQKVFETQNEYVGWDGTFRGADQNIDTYYYIMQYKCDGKDQEQKGEVILLR
jgi:gliding motility-associated-like protein